MRGTEDEQGGRGGLESKGWSGGAPLAGVVVVAGGGLGLEEGGGGEERRAEKRRK